VAVMAPNFMTDFVVTMVKYVSKVTHDVQVVAGLSVYICCCGCLNPSALFCCVDILYRVQIMAF
jgi:hypothetical protein